MDYCIVEHDLNSYLTDLDKADREHVLTCEEADWCLHNASISELYDVLDSSQRSMLEDMIYQLAQRRVKEADAEQTLNHLLNNLENKE